MTMISHVKTKKYNNSVYCVVHYSYWVNGFYAMWIAFKIMIEVLLFKIIEGGIFKKPH